MEQTLDHFEACVLGRIEVSVTVVMANRNDNEDWPCIAGELASFEQMKLESRDNHYEV